MNNNYEDKAYIENGQGISKEADEKYILEHGYPFPVEVARMMIR